MNRGVSVWRAACSLGMAALILLLLPPGDVAALGYNSDNDAALAIFHMGGTARGQAMGGAYASLARGSEATYWNPGGLAYQSTSFEVQVSPRIFRGEDYELGENARSLFVAQGGYRWNRWGTWALGAGLLRHDIGDIVYNGGNVSGDLGSGGSGPNDVSADNTFSNAQTGIVIALGGTFLKDHLGVGVAARSLSNSFSGLDPEWVSSHREVATSGSGTSLTAGATYRLNADFAAAGVVDLPSKVDWGGRLDDSAMRVQTALSYRFLRGPGLSATAAAQMENIGGAWARAHVGFELTTFKLVSIRAGIKNLHLKSAGLATSDLNDAGAFTLGVGTSDLKLMSRFPVALDVAFDSQDFNSQVVTTLKVGF